MNTETYAERLIARLFLCSKSAYTKNRISGGLFSENVTIKTLRFFAFRLCRCSTVKSRSKREKLYSASLRGVRALLSASAENFNNTKSQTRY